jgi:hypothetical protein
MRLKLSERQVNMLKEDDNNAELRHNPDNPKLSDIELFYDDSLGYFLGRNEWDTDLNRWFPYSKNSNFFKTPAEACHAYNNKKYKEMVESKPFGKALNEEMNQNSLGNPCEYAAKMSKNESMKKRPTIKLSKKQINRLFESLNPDNTGINVPNLPEGTVLTKGHPVAGTGGKEYNPQSVDQNKQTFKSFNESELKSSDPYEIFINNEFKGSAASTSDLKSKTDSIVKSNKIHPHNIEIVVKYANSKPRAYSADEFLNWLEKHKHLNMEAYKLDENIINEDFSIIGSLLEFGKQVIELLTNLLNDPSNQGLSPFWHRLGVSRGELLKILIDFGIVSTVGYKTHVVAKNLKNNIRRLYSHFKNYQPKDELAPAKNTYKSAPEESIEEDNLTPPEAPEQVRLGNNVKVSSYKVSYVNDEISILKDNDSNLYFFYYGGVDKKDFMEYPEVSRTYVGKDDDNNPDYEYGDFDVDAQAVQNYVNDNLNELSVGEGIEGYNNGNDIVKIDNELKIEILKSFPSERLKNILDLYVKDGLGEATTASSSGSFTAPMSFNPEAPKTGTNSASPDSSVIKRPIGSMINASVLASLITLAEAKLKIRKDGSAAQVKKNTLNYRISDNKNIVCSNCVHFHEETKQCDRVIAKVNSEYVCDSYKGKAVEETSAASSGSYTQPSIWAASKADMKFGKKPAWDGGTIVESLRESINVNGKDEDDNYLEKQIEKDKIEHPRNVFKGTIYRMPTDEELKQFEKFPKETASQIAEEIGYTIVGRGIQSDDNIKLMKKAAARLMELFPNNTKYKEVANNFKDAKSHWESKSKDETIEESNFDTPSYGGNEKSGGGFVHLDSCVKLNNNKDAIHGHCSKGAVDKVVKIDKINNNPSIY